MIPQIAQVLSWNARTPLKSTGKGQLTTGN
jgi:hypothetical protein